MDSLADSLSGACCPIGGTDFRVAGFSVSPHPKIRSFAFGNEATDLLNIDHGLCIFSRYTAWFTLDHLNNGWWRRVHALWLWKVLIHMRIKPMFW